MAGEARSLPAVRSSGHPVPPAEHACPESGDAPGIAVLTRRMSAGNEEAYRDFFARYQPRLFRYLLVVTRDETLATEALQHTLLRVVKHIRPFSDEHIFWSWLGVLARSAAADQGRKRTRYFRVIERLRHEFPFWSKPTTPGPGDATPEQELLASLDRELATLPPDDRELLREKYFIRMSVREIALARQTSEKAVESRLVRLRQKLRKILLEKLAHETEP